MGERSGGEAALNPVFAHGLGTAPDAPLPLALILAALALAVAATAAAVERRTRELVPAAVPARRQPLAFWLARTVLSGSARNCGGAAGDGAAAVAGRNVYAGAPDARGIASRPRWRTAVGLRALRAGGVALCSLVVAAAVLGSGDPARNLAPALVLGVGWPVVLLSSVVLGPWWPLGDPLRVLARAAARLAGDPAESAARPLPRATPWLAWAAVVSVAWAAAVRPPGVGSFTAWLSVTALVHLAGAARCGTAWLDRIEPFTAASRLLGLLAPERARAAAAAATGIAPGAPDARHVAGALVGWGLCDLLLESPPWQRAVPDGDVLAGTAALLACAWLAATVLRRLPVRAARGHTAVAALAAGWVGALHLAPLMVQGQAVAIWLSDPLSRGWDLLGTAGAHVQFAPLPFEWLAALAVAVFLAGHLVAVGRAHGAAVAVHGRRRAGAAQLEWRAVLLASLCGGAALMLAGA